MKRVSTTFFETEEVTLLAQKMLGMELCVAGLHGWRRAIITETEAYAGIADRGSHAFGGRKTKRNEQMYGPAGHLYMYLCYGMHWMLNVVTAAEGVPHAILIRALRPLEPAQQPVDVARGPGKLSRWLGIDGSFNGESVDGGRFILQHATDASPLVVASPRIGIAYAADHAHLPYRFYLAGEASVSRPLKPSYPKNENG
ncbi:MAG: DNA-3-methyladenine glycosylase [Sphingobacteriaceae bacterium]|nr:DNA-3-methyladenine glycosylase [Sphingobacteriaceae bacterium]